MRILPGDLYSSTHSTHTAVGNSMCKQKQSNSTTKINSLSIVMSIVNLIKRNRENNNKGKRTQRRLLLHLEPPVYSSHKAPESEDHQLRPGVEKKRENVVK